MKHYYLFETILTLLFMFPQHVWAFSPDDTLVCGKRTNAIGKPHTYGRSNQETSILFYNPEDTILIRMYGGIEEMPARPSVTVPILTESPFFILHSDEELKDIVRTCINETKRKEWYEKHIRIEIAVLLDKDCHCTEVVHAVEAPDDGGAFQRLGISFGTSRFIIDFKDGDVDIVMRPPSAA